MIVYNKYRKYIDTQLNIWKDYKIDLPHKIDYYVDEMMMMMIFNK